MNRNRGDEGLYLRFAARPAVQPAGLRYRLIMFRKHPEKTTIGDIDRGFDFFWYHSPGPG